MKIKIYICILIASFIAGNEYKAIAEERLQVEEEQQKQLLRYEIIRSIETREVQANQDTLLTF